MHGVGFLVLSILLAPAGFSFEAGESPPEGAGRGEDRAFVRIPLDGEWQCRPLPGKKEKGTREGGEESGWRPIRVPACFEEVLGSGFDGDVEYRREFRLPGGKDRRWFLRFGAVMTRARVLVDGVEVGSHLGGWTPFRIEITKALGPGILHRLHVVVREEVGHSLQGFLPAIQPHFGGIWQSVHLEGERGPVLDREHSWVVGRFPEGRARVLGEVRFRGVGRGRIRFLLEGGGTRLLDRSLDFREGRVELDLPAGSVRSWSPENPVVHAYRIELLDSGGKAVDAIEGPLAFREVEVRGRSIRLNGRFFVPRGVLHWGYDTKSLDPGEGAAFWRREMRRIRSFGFNLVKACLWLPPPSFFRAALEEGVAVWLEYPAWHPDFSAARLPELLREYDEFFRVDRDEAAVLLRSLTCETGRAKAAEETVRILYERCKEKTGGVLVEDDSSWISWNRYHDFYDDHPYGNRRGWAARLRGFDRYIREHGSKPLVLGEALAADTWADLGAIERRLAGDPDPWWKPRAFASQKAFEKRMGRLYGEGAAARLLAESKAFALAQRKFQIEVFRLLLPRAGYVSSVWRDIPKCRMGYLDDLDRPKWTAEDFSWHRDLMLVLDEERALRSVDGGALERSPLRVRLAGDLLRLVGRTPMCRWIWRRERWRKDGGYVPAAAEREGRSPWLLEGDRRGLSAPFRVPWGWPRGSEDPERWTLDLRLEGLASNRWTFHVLPRPSGTGAGKTGPGKAPVRFAKGMEPSLLRWVEEGGALVLQSGGRGGPRSGALWWLQGAPFARAGPAVLPGLPRDLCLELFDLDLDGRPFANTPLSRAFAPLLGFWDTHDEEEEVQVLYSLAEARVGKGRILLCGLDLSERPEPPLFSGGEGGGETPGNPARAILRRALTDYLRNSRPPEARLSRDLLLDWKEALGASKTFLDGIWKLRKDPKDRGLEEGWMKPGLEDQGWLRSRTGVHWEKAGLPHYDGIAWYRKTFVPPPWWRKGTPLHLVFEGVDDSYILFLNGRRVAAFGDPETGETVWLVRTSAEISPFLHEGANILALRVVDHGGAGGLHRRVYLSSGRPELEDLVDK